ncbi:unnamed protein product, partial [Ectocarpus sp. 12 AP-2014]
VEDPSVSYPPWHQPLPLQQRTANVGAWGGQGVDPVTAGAGSHQWWVGTGVGGTEGVGCDFETSSGYYSPAYYPERSRQFVGGPYTQGVHRASSSGLAQTVSRGRGAGERDLRDMNVVRQGGSGGVGVGF